MIKENTIYLCGPMTNYPQFNFPAFDKEAAILRKLGLIVYSPAEMDDDKTREAALASLDGKATMPDGQTWIDFLVRDLKIVADVAEAVVVMPGWNKSKGARLETFVAYLSNKPVYYAGTLKRVPFKNLVTAWVGSGFYHSKVKKISTSTKRDKVRM